MLNETEDLIADAIAGADEFRESRPNESKQRLLVDRANPDHTVAALRDILANSGDLFDRGVPVRITYNQTQHGHAAQALTPYGLILNAHSFCRPFAIKVKNGDTSEVDIGLPFPFARMYLDWRGEWKLPPLNGIATAPLLHEDGAIVSAKGYDRSSGMWCENVPDLTGLVPERPTKDQAAAALLRIRETFKTFCFADAETVEETARGVPVVDLTRAPGQDESSFLVASLTAVCRPSLHLAPGVLIRAAPLSGAGAGKGLLARCMCIIAFGREPHAVTSGATGEEMEKRIGAELIAASPALFLDNLNNTTFKSDLLASAITERPAKVRMLGRSEMVLLNATALVLLTGNGITVSEDLARRFIEIELDPRIENPEARPFTTDIRTEVMRRRSELLGALLTIWRWGRIATGLEKGLPLGSFDQWCQWVRDPLLVLGCHDPVLRLTAAKERDARRQNVAEIFTIWWERHGKNPVALSGLHEDVKNAADPQSRGRQYLSAFFDRLAGTRMVGFVLTRQAAPGKWGVATYALKKTDDGHRDHRGRQAKTDISDDPYGPNADLHRKAA
jgi:hypothetical protein